MNTRSTPFFDQIKLRIVLVILLMVSVIACLAFLFYTSGQDKYLENRLVEILGRQRMYTQQMAKDASRLYILLQTRDSEVRLQSLEVIDSKIETTKKDLLDTKDRFSSVLDQIQTGVILSGNRKIAFDNTDPDIRGTLEQINGIWGDFSRAVDVVIRSDRIDTDFKYATIYINENNEGLRDYCDKLLNAGINETQQHTKANTRVTVFFTAIAFIILGISVFSLYRYFIGPLTEIYKGFSEVGITSEHLNRAMPTKHEVRPIVDEIRTMFRELDIIFSLIENINGNSSFSEVLEYIFRSFSFFIPYNYIGVALLKNSGTSLEASYGISDGSVTALPEALFNKEYAISETSLKKILDSGHARIINDLESYTADRPVMEYTRIVMEAGIQSSITLPLKKNNKDIGVIFFSSRSVNAYNDEHVKFLRAIVNSIAISFDKNLFMDDLLYSSLIAITKLAEARDEDTGLHLERIKVYSKAIAQFLFLDSGYKNCMTPEYINDIEKFSPMHDIGKVGVRDGILLKPGKLTYEEFEEMKKHTVFGAGVLRAAESHIANSGRSVFKVGIEIAESHHEKWNGSGYPYGKSGEDIPLSARIVAVADVFDALTSKRPYKEAFPFEQSFESILEGSGKHFDPEIVNAFGKNKQAIYDLYKDYNTRSE
jgi:HD-GYP domain-containing protein (c-di-GMP phosphodiesterase class II)